MGKLSAFAPARIDVGAGAAPIPVTPTNRNIRGDTRRRSNRRVAAPVVAVETTRRLPARPRATVLARRKTPG
ncbi:MAG: hypothetical protein AAGB00_12950 [Planctomycetota bacterium]